MEQRPILATKKRSLADDIRQYRERAAECLRLSDTAPTVMLRNQYAELSRTWRQLAERRVSIVQPGHYHVLY
jgi:hypothetical protein